MSYLGINLLNYSGDTNIKGSAGNTYITQDGDESSNTGNVIISGAGNVVLVPGVSGDVYTEAWTDHNPTISGWASTTTKRVKYKTIGDLVFVDYSINGSGNGDDTGFSLPCTPIDDYFTHRPAAGANSKSYLNTVSLLSRAWICVNTEGSPLWGSGVNKWVCGSFWYQKA